VDDPDQRTDRRILAKEGSWHPYKLLCCGDFDKKSLVTRWHKECSLNLA